MCSRLMVPTVGNACWHERLEEVENVSDVLVQRVVPDRTGQSRGGPQEEAQQDPQSHPVLANSYYEQAYQEDENVGDNLELFACFVNCDSTKVHSTIRQYDSTSK